MSGTTTPPLSRAGLRAAALGLALFALTACGEDAVGPTSLAPAGDPLDPATPPAPAEPAAAGVLDTRSGLPGIVFASFSMENKYITSVHTGWMQGGAISPSNILSQLSGAKAKGGRVFIKLSMGLDKYVKNGDGTFSLTKWKSLVDRFKSVNIAPYIKDGTFIAHYLIDEPHRASRWGGKAISQATLEEMARHSKNLWPDLTTVVRVAPSYLASSSITYQHLDAGWTQYTAGKGDAASWVKAEAAAAGKKGLGLVVGMNVLDGGNGSSKIRGRTSGKWAMSATEVRNYGTAMLSSTLACGFVNWTHDENYYNRSDIKSAFADISAKAKAHAKTHCRQ